MEHASVKVVVWNRKNKLLNEQTLNILWDRNEEMCTAELTEAVNEVYNRRWEKGLIQEFINLLIRMDYVEKKRHGFRVYYTALGSDYEL